MPDICRNANPIPILVYHQIDVAPPKGAAFRALYVAPDAFARQMRLLWLLGYQGLSMSGLLPYLRGEKTGKVVGITFDDGYLNNLTHALPVLQRHGFSSTCYAVSQRLGQTNSWDQQAGILQTMLMDAAQLRKWVKGGQEVGAHTRHHVHLPELGVMASMAEIAGCKSELESLLQTPVAHFCYPYGQYTDAHVRLAQQAGVVTATTTVRGRCAMGSDLLQLPRVPVVRSTSLPVLWLKLATAYEDAASHVTHQAGSGIAAAQRLRIAVLNRQFSVTGGGAERYSIALVEQLAAHHDIHVFAQHIEHRWPGVTYHRVSCLTQRPRWFNQLWYAVVTWWATLKGFDVVHSHENTWHGNVQTVHVLPLRYNLFHGRTGWALAWRWLKVLTSVRLLVYLLLERGRFAVAKPRALVATSASLSAHMVEAYPACEFAIKIVTPGIDSIAPAVSFEKKHQARQRLKLPVPGHAILFVGNDYQKKGLASLIAALAQLPADCYAVVVGNPGNIPQFKLQATALSVAQRVFFLGTQNNMDEAYSAADCLAHPTLEDTFAMVVLEAMAHGLPVVVSGQRYCGIAGLLTHEKNALLLDDPTNAKTLADALTRVLTDRHLAQGLRESAQSFAKNYAWSAMALQQESIYRAVSCRPKR